MQPALSCEQAASIPEPCTIVIFGASGDLTSRKLIPDLFALHLLNKLPEPFTIVGCSRTVMDDDRFREHLFAHLDSDHQDRDKWSAFAAKLHYFSITYDEQGFLALADRLAELDRPNRIFNLAVPPNLYPVIAELLGRSGLAGEHGEGKGWSRIVVEKPFGHDLRSARELNTILHDHFREEQIFRIDHYMAKETVQNTLIFRFANSIFEPLWNRHHIEYVGIMASEELGVENRAGYYEDAGVLRDMFQNHMMQLLVLTAMEPPWCYEAEAVQDEKAKVIRSLRKFSINEGSRICLGQYGEGSPAETPLPAYLAEKGVRPDSSTPTFAMMELYIDNWRWQDVPFYLVSGKRLPSKQTRIIIQFREVPHRLFRDVLNDGIGANRLIIETYPDQSIRLTFQSKHRGTALCLRTLTMDFSYNTYYPEKSLDAYARVLLDCMAGDHMLFWRQDGIELSWAFLTPVLEECETCSPERLPLHVYPAGTWGPEAAGDVMRLLVE